MALYKLTYMNGGGKTRIEKANFESDKKAEAFIEKYNSTNSNAKIIQAIKFVALMSEKKKSEFLNKKFNTHENLDLKIMYYTTNKKAFNISIPYIPTDFTQTKLDSLMSYINNFNRIEDIQYKETKFF